MLGSGKKAALAQAYLTSIAAGAVTRRLFLSLLESQHAVFGAGTQARPNMDPQQQSAASLFSLNTQPRLLMGVITDTAVVAHAYRVQFEKYKQPMVGVWMADSSVSAFGPRDMTTLQPGTAVLALVHQHLQYAIILGVLPPADINGKSAYASVLLGASRQRVDEAHKKPIKMHANGNIPNWTAGRPIDSTTAGEKGWITETGGRIGIDSFLAQLAVDESCGVFAFFHDQLLRLTGQNLQLWASGMEWECLLDGSEYDEIRGVTPYPWEQLGLFEPGDPRRELKAEEWQLKEPYYSKWEPKDDRQMPWHRARDIRGYLGQGGLDIVQVAPKETTKEYTSFQGGKGEVGAEHPAVFQQWTGLNGFHAIASAAGISIVKRAGLLSPTRLRRAEDLEGDTEDGYRFAGKNGDGAEHTITGGPAAEGADPHMQQIAGILDLHAYIFNYAGIHPFHYHNKDWKVPEESELTWTQGQTIKFQELGLADLASKTILPPPKPIKLKVDHRYGEQDYYQTECGIDLTQHGGVTIYDTWGSELRLCGGSLWAAAAGDIWLQPGRNINLWAGWDIIGRAKNSMDFTTSDHDIRLKAERNIEILAGNAKIGGVLIESRAEGPVYNFEEFGEGSLFGGIILKAYKSEIINWGRNIYLRTGGGDVDEGTITLDAARGDFDITTHSRTFNNYVSNGVFHFFGSDGDVRAANGFQEQFCGICAETYIDSHHLVAGHCLNTGWLFVAGGHIATELAPNYQLLVPPLQGDGLRQVYEAVAKGGEALNTEIVGYGTRFFDSAYEELYYTARRPGNDDVIEQGSFSLRAITEYRTENFKLYEARWQQMSRMAELELPKWKEKAVATRGQEFYPYPGKEWFQSSSAAPFIQQDLTIFEFPEGRSSPRSGDDGLNDNYKNPKYGEPKAVSLNEYTVIR